MRACWVVTYAARQPQVCNIVVLVLGFFFDLLHRQGGQKHRYRYDQKQCNIYLVKQQIKFPKNDHYGFDRLYSLTTLYKARNEYKAQKQSLNKCLTIVL